MESGNQSSFDSFQTESFISLTKLMFPGKYCVPVAYGWLSCVLLVLVLFYTASCIHYMIKMLTLHIPLKSGTKNLRKNS